MTPNHTAAPLLEVRNLKKYFPVRSEGKKKMLHAVDDVSFEIMPGETFGLVGESGCGKSTVARTVTRIYKPTAGEMLLGGQEIGALSEKKLQPLRRRVQMIFQDPYASLNSRMTVADSIAEPLIAHGEKDKKRRSEMVAQLLRKVGLEEDHMSRYPHEFSGGQRQRICIARALILQPELVVCDEPISALDVSIQAQIVNMLREFQEELSLTYLFIAHDLSMVRYISNRVGVMYLGRIMEMCTSEEIYERPLHPYTRALLASVPIPDPEAASARKMVALEGDIPSPIDPPPGCRFAARCPHAQPVCREKDPLLRQLGEKHQVACHFAGEI